MQLLEWSKLRFVVLIYILLKAIHPKYHQTQHLAMKVLVSFESVGSSVNNFKVGDKVIVFCIVVVNVTTVKRYLCTLWKRWRLDISHLIDGTQAEYVKVPFADNFIPCTRIFTRRSTRYALDILATGYEIGVLKGKVKPGSTVSIVGAGPD